MTEPKVEVIARGQPRRYADTQLIVKVTFPDQAQDMKLEWVVQRLIELQCGFMVKKSADVNWPDAYLDYLHQLGPGVWEFRIVYPYTD